MPPVIEATWDYIPTCIQPSELMDGSLMSNDEMQVFANFCADSGASEEVAELTKIQGELTSMREGVPSATGESSALAPRITISGRSAKEAVLEGMRHLDKEFSERQTSVAKAAQDVKKLIEQGMDKLNRLSNKRLSVLTSAEDKHLSRKSALQQRE